MDALIRRSYEKPLNTAKTMSEKEEISCFTRMAMIFQACRNSSTEFLRDRSAEGQQNLQENAYIHQKYMSHLISELKPALTEIIQQGIASGEIRFSNPAALAEIVLIVLTVKLDNTLVPSTPQSIEDTIHGLIELLEKGTDTHPGVLNYLTVR